MCEAKVGYFRTFMVDIGVIDKHDGKKWLYQTATFFLRRKISQALAVDWFLYVKFLRWGLEKKLFV